jgi:hypothetical protein
MAVAAGVLRFDGIGAPLAASSENRPELPAAHPVVGAVGPGDVIEDKYVTEKRISALAGTDDKIAASATKQRIEPLQSLRPTRLVPKNGAGLIKVKMSTLA